MEFAYTRVHSTSVSLILLSCLFCRVMLAASLSHLYHIFQSSDFTWISIIAEAVFLRSITHVTSHNRKWSALIEFFTRVLSENVLTHHQTASLSEVICRIYDGVFEMDEVTRSRKVIMSKHIIWIYGNLILIQTRLLISCAYCIFALFLSVSR